ENRLWGAERVRGELLRLGVRVCKRTVQKYMRQVRAPRPRGQTWVAFLRNHGHHIWACGFLQTFDVCFRPAFAFFIVELSSRRVLHVGVTRHPTDAWVAQQLREATPFGQHPKHLISQPHYPYIHDQSYVAQVLASLSAVCRCSTGISGRFLTKVPQRPCQTHGYQLNDHGPWVLAVEATSVARHSHGACRLCRRSHPHRWIPIRRWCGWCGHRAESLS